MQALRSSFNAVFAISLHLILTTKYRRRVLDGAMLRALESLTRESCARWESPVVEFNGEADHVHVLLDMHPKVRPSDLVGVIKTRSSRTLRRDFPALRAAYRGKAVLWSSSYCLLSAGGAPIEVLKRYIQNQATPR